MTAPRVAMVVPSRNRRQKTVRFLSRVRTQDYPNLAIYLTDSNSTDGTVRIVSQSFPSVRVVQASDEDYWTGATNLGVKAALADGADYILTINDDAVVRNDFVARMVEIAQREDLKVLAARIDFLDRPGKIFALGGEHDWKAGLIFQLRHFGRYVDELDIGFQGREIERVGFAPGDGVLIARDVFERVGLYDAKNYPHYHADSELLMRAARHKIPTHVALHVVVYNDTSDFVEKSTRHLESVGELGEVPKSYWVSLKVTARKARALATDKRSAKYYRCQLHCILRYGDNRLALLTSYLKMLFDEVATDQHDWAYKKLRKKVQRLGTRLLKWRVSELLRRRHNKRAMKLWLPKKGH